MMANLQTVADVVDRLATFEDQPCTIVVGKEDVDTWTYAQMAERSGQLARGLLHAGMQTDECVLLFSTPRPMAFLAILAAIRAGAMVAPIDIQMADDVLAGVLRDCRPRWVFTTSDHQSRLREHLPSDARFVLLDSSTPLWEQFPPGGEVLPDIDPEQHAALFYTSGTTGPPKGVPLTHANLAFQFRTLIDIELVTLEDRVLLPLPLHHVYPFVIGTLTPLALGLPIVLPFALTGPELIRSLQVGRVSVMAGVPGLYRALDEAISRQVSQSPLPARWLFKGLLATSLVLRKRLGWRVGRRLFRRLHERLGPSLRLMASGGAPLSDRLAWRLEALGWQVAIGYGLTETSPLITLNLPDSLRIGSVGRVVPGVTARIVPLATSDDESARPAPVDAKRSGTLIGELQVRGPNVFHGYLNLPEKTAAAFTADGFFRTGDLGHFDEDGYLYLHGRANTMIVTEGGENIQPEDLEEVYAAEPVIKEIGILQHEGKLAAIVVPEHSVASQPLEQAVEQAIARVSRRLPSYQRIVDYVIQSEALPRTRLGKIQRHKLAQRYERDVSGDGQPTGPIPIDEMASEDQALLESPAALRTWQWLAQRYADRRLTPDSNLQLDLGVDSLDWLNLTVEIGQHTGIELTDQDIRQIESVRDLLARVAEAGASQGPRHDPLADPEAVLDAEQLRWVAPLSPLERRLSRAGYRLNRWLMRALFRVEASGVERLATLDRFVLAPNHVSYLDAFALAAALDDGTLARTSWAAWVGVAFSNRFTRLASRLSFTIPIDPGRGAISSLALAALIIRSERNLVLFPEGERSRTGEVLPLKPGLGLLLERYPRPVVPVYIRGTYEAMPVGRAIPRRVPVRVCFGEPVEPDVLDREGTGDSPHERMMTALRQRMIRLGHECPPREPKA